MGQITLHLESCAWSTILAETSLIQAIHAPLKSTFPALYAFRNAPQEKSAAVTLL